MISTTAVLYGKQCKITIISGQIIGYKENRDTHVYGGGDAKSGIIVSSQLNISTDVWFKESESGKEFHVFYTCALNSRIGNVIHIIDISDFIEGNLLAGVYNSSTGNYILMHESSQKWNEFMQEGLFMAKDNNNGPIMTIFVAILGMAALVSVIGIPIALYFTYRQNEQLKAKKHQFGSDLDNFVRANVPNLVADIHNRLQDKTA